MSDSYYYNEHYEILGISKNATLEEVKKAYKKKSKTAHPDRGGSHEEFCKLESAYATIIKLLKEKGSSSPSRKVPKVVVTRPKIVCNYDIERSYRDNRRIYRNPIGSVVRIKNFRDIRINGSWGEIRWYDKTSKKYVVYVDGWLRQKIESKYLFRIIEKVRIRGSKRVVDIVDYDKKTDLYEISTGVEDVSELIERGNCILPLGTLISIKTTDSSDRYNGTIGMITNVREADGKYEVEVEKNNWLLVDLNLVIVYKA